MSSPTAVRNLFGLNRKVRTTLADAISLAGRGVPVSGTEYYVDAANGSDSGDGDSWDAALLTMSEAFDRIASGDVIYMRGQVTEQLTAPVQIFDVSIIGVANRPRHADSTPSGGESGANWQPPGSPTANTPLLEVIQQGWTVANILFDAPSDAAAIKLLANSDSGDDERSAGHFSAYGCKFLSGDSGLEDNGSGLAFAWIQDCEFNDLTNAVTEVTGAGAGQPALRATFRDCHFRSNTTTDIVLPAQEMVIEGCTFDGASSGATIDLSGGVGSNVVTRNTLGGTYSIAGGYTAGTGDVWFGNYGSSGITSGDPA